MLIISLITNLLNIIKVKTLKCMSVTNQQCKPRPKIIDVNTVSESVYYPYSVLINRCSGSCNDLKNPMAKFSVPDITKSINMKAYNLLMRANETKNVLWHETCKCVCRLTSAVCNKKQIWNSDTCTCDCNKDFTDKMVCKKGYLWNPSTCACECDMWCKPVQYLDYKNCVCKNQLIGKINSVCTSLINESLVNVDDNIVSSNDNNTNIYIGLFSLFMLLGVVGFCVFAYFKWIKGKNLFEERFNNNNFNDVSEINNDF